MLDKQILQQWRRAPEILRQRGPLHFALLAFREICRPFLYWYVWYIFQSDLTQPLAQPYAKRDVDVKIYAGPEAMETALPIIASMGELAGEEIELRFRRGDAAAVGWSENKPVGCMWLTFASGLELALGTGWLIRPGEAVRYSSFVIPEARGYGIHSFLNRALHDYARGRGVTLSLASVSALNSQSLSLAKHSGLRKTMTLIVIRIRGLNWTYRKAMGAPFSSRFVQLPAKAKQAS